jgi:hypothetical protein
LPVNPKHRRPDAIRRNGAISSRRRAGAERLGYLEVSDRCANRLEPAAVRDTVVITVRMRIRMSPCVSTKRAIRNVIQVVG